MRSDFYPNTHSTLSDDKGQNRQIAALVACARAYDTVSIADDDEGRPRAAITCCLLGQQTAGDVA